MLDINNIIAATSYPTALTVSVHACRCVRHLSTAHVRARAQVISRGQYINARKSNSAINLDGGIKKHFCSISRAPRDRINRAWKRQTFFIGRTDCRNKRKKRRKKTHDFHLRLRTISTPYTAADNWWSMFITITLYYLIFTNKRNIVYCTYYRYAYRYIVPIYQVTRARCLRSTILVIHKNIIACNDV